MKIYTKKIILFYLIIPLFIVVTLYLLLPYILNYPPNSIDNTFQKNIDGINYTEQFILITIMCTIISIIILLKNVSSINLFYNKINNNNTKNKQYYYDNITKLCVSTPIKLYLAQIIIPFVLTPLVLLFIGANILVIVKISSIFILFLSLSATITYVFSQSEFKKILIEIYKNQKNVNNNIMQFHPKISMKLKLILELIPIIIVALLFTSLLSYTVNSKITGNIYYNLYFKELSQSFNNKAFNNFADIVDQLEKINIDENITSKFIIQPNGEYKTLNNSNLSRFFIQYIINYSSSNRTYDYYCTDNEGTFIPVNTVDGNLYYVGVSYNTSSLLFFKILLLSFVILLIIIISILIYVSDELSKNIKSISDRLNMIIINKNINNYLPVVSNDEIGYLVVSFNKVQEQQKEYITQIKNNQEMLIEQERLASLGQMIGGISHNLKTPIMSISGAAEGLTDLINEYDASIGDSEVTNEDNHAIANDMRVWIEKIHTYTNYMSDIITAVKGQAVKLSENEQDTFTVDELVKRVTILMKNEVQTAHGILNVKTNNLNSLELHGNVNSLVQVVNNLIANAIQSYRDEPNGIIDFTIAKSNTNAIITVEDHGCGIPKDVQEKLFKEMTTTKGKKGTGLGLFMSYSTIKGNFKGDMTFETEEGKGTKFIITIPM